MEGEARRGEEWEARSEEGKQRDEGGVKVIKKNILASDSGVLELFEKYETAKLTKRVFSGVVSKHPTSKLETLYVSKK